MGYLHIDNLYKDRTILLFRECYALEKVHGTSAHIGYSQERGLYLFSGGSEHHVFTALFDLDAMKSRLAEMAPVGGIAIYGEAYGGKMQRMGHAYGNELRFIAFDVKKGDRWFQVEQAAGCVAALGLEFVPFERTSTDLASLDLLRDMPSDVAKRRGITEDKHREGVVLRPLQEFATSNGGRIIAKHKGDAFSERRNTPKVGDPDKIKILADAAAISGEWVTPMRLQHILGRGTIALDTANIPDFITAMVEDVEREALGEIVVSKEARRAIGTATAILVKEALAARLISEAHP
jgi:hypothetical protein